MCASFVEWHDTRVVNHFGHNNNGVTVLNDLDIVVIHAWRERRARVKAHDATLLKYRGLRKNLC